jgi:hypothetical protein
MKMVVSIILTTILSANLFSQEAEKIYHTDYSKLSIVLQPAKLMASTAYNHDGSTYPNMAFTESFSIQAGVYYNFAQSKNFNFKTGVILKTFHPVFDLNVSAQDIGYSGYEQDNYLTDFDFENQIIVSVPFIVEYYLKINPKLNIVLGAGLDLNLFTGFDGPTITSIDVGNFEGTEEKEIFSSYSTGQSSITFSREISAGINYKTKFSLIQIEFFYNKNLGPTQNSGQYSIYNLENSPDKEGSFYIENDFYGISLIFSPKKGWLTKKP